MRFLKETLERPGPARSDHQERGRGHLVRLVLTLPLRPSYGQVNLPRSEPKPVPTAVGCVPRKTVPSQHDGHGEVALTLVPANLPRRGSRPPLSSSPRTRHDSECSSPSQGESGLNAISPPISESPPEVDVSWNVRLLYERSLISRRSKGKHYVYALDRDGNAGGEGVRSPHLSTGALIALQHHPCPASLHRRHRPATRPRRIVARPRRNC